MVLHDSSWFLLGGLFSDVQLGFSSFLPPLLLVKAVGSLVCDQESGGRTETF